MIYLRYESESLAPTYGTLWSSGADLCARQSVSIPAHGHAKVPTGVWIDRVEWDKVPAQMIPELQVRARSGLAAKKQIMLTNGVGTVDADYPGEICVLMTNLGPSCYEVAQGSRVAQLVMSLVCRIPGLEICSEKRLGGFGSTGIAGRVQSASASPEGSATANKA